MAKDSKTKTFVLRINSEHMAAIEKWAEDEFRSVNGQILAILSDALKKSRRMPKNTSPKSRGNNTEDKSEQSEK